VDGETDKWLSKLAELKALIVQRLDYAKSSQGHMAIKRAESIQDPEKMREYITVQRQHFELQERIARRLMDWHDNMEKALNETKDHIDEMFWQAVLASIPAEVKSVGAYQVPKAQETT
jgi:molecular chaperone GrpE (heat shock protein)